MTSKRFKKLPIKTTLMEPTLIEKLIPTVKSNCTTNLKSQLI